MKLLLHIQFSFKQYIDREFEDDVTLKDMINQFIDEGILGRYCNTRPAQSDYALMINDVVLENSRESTLKECNIVNGEDIYIAELDLLNNGYRFHINIRIHTPLENNSNINGNNNNLLRIDNLSHFQTVGSVIKLIAPILNRPYSEIRLIHAGKQMEAFKTLSNSCLQIDSTVNLIFRTSNHQKQ